MKNIIETELALKMSAAILLKKGEISTRNIRAFPFLSDDFDTNLIINSLLRLYDTELIRNKISSSPFLEWEEIIRLRRNRPETRNLTK
jgi:hypothetical protein